MKARLLKLTFFLLLTYLLPGLAGKAWAVDDQDNWINFTNDIEFGSDKDIEISITNDEATDTTYIVKTAKGLAWIAKVTNEEKKKGDDGADDNYPSAVGFYGCTVKLNEDIDLSDHYWTPIGSTTANANTPTFNGIFNGNHKMVKGLKVNVTKTAGSAVTSDYHAGLFGKLYTNSSVSNLGIQIANEGVEGNSQKGDSYVGGLAGYNAGTISNCFVIPASGSGGAVKSEGNNDYKYVGGLVGLNQYGTITDCYTTVNVSTRYGKPEVGGIAGYAAGAVSNVYATGEVGTAEATGYDCAGGIIGCFYGGTLSNALALNKEGITGGTVSGSGNNSYNGAGRIAGVIYRGQVTSSCYASTQIRMNGNVKGASKSSNDNLSHSDGTDADTDTKLGELFSTGDNDAWVANGDDNLPKLKGFTGEQPQITIASYLDAPLDITNGSAFTLTYAGTGDVDNPAAGWKSGETSFSGRIKGASEAASLSVSSTDTEEALLTFADGFNMKATNNTAAITIGNNSTVTLASEGTATVKAEGYIFSIPESSSCSFDPTNRFLFYGNILEVGAFPKGLMGWQWNSAPQSDVTVEWTNGSVTIPCSDGNAYTHLATNPAGDNITVKVGTEGQKGKKNGEGDPVSTFNFDNNDTKSYIYYSEMADRTKGTEDNPYVVDFANLSNGADANKYSYASGSGTITLFSPGSYYRLEGDGSSTIVYTTLTLSTGNDAYHLLAAPSFTPGNLILQIPASTTCIVEGFQELKATNAKVEGTLTLDAPLTLEEKGGDLRNNCLHITNSGSVTANNVLKVFSEKGRAILVGDDSGYGTFTIGNNGKVYGYGGNIGFGSNGSLAITENGILRLAAGTFSANGTFIQPLIMWNTVGIADKVLNVKDSEGTIATFSEKEFGSYFAKAQSFTTNVKANTEYTLWLESGGKQLQGLNEADEITKVYSTKSGRSYYNNVGIPAVISNNPDKVTITDNGKYKIGDNGQVRDFNNMLSGTIKELEINTTASPLYLNGVTVSKLTVTPNGYSYLYLDNSCYLERIEIQNKGGLSISPTSRSLTNTEVTNNGTFSDVTGQITFVTIPVNDGLTLTMSPKITGSTEAPQGGTTKLTASPGINESITTRADNAYTHETAYKWDKWNENTKAWLKLLRQIQTKHTMPPPANTAAGLWKR